MAMQYLGHEHKASHISLPNLETILQRPNSRKGFLLNQHSQLKCRQFSYKYSCIMCLYTSCLHMTKQYYMPPHLRAHYPPTLGAIVDEGVALGQALAGVPPREVYTGLRPPLGTHQGNEFLLVFFVCGGGGSGTGDGG